MQAGVTHATLHIRRATGPDIPFLAWCNFEATSPAPGFSYWDPLLEGLNTPTLTFIEAVLAVDGLAWGKTGDFLLVEESGAPIAGASGFVMDTTDYRPLRLAQLPAVAARLSWSDTHLQEFQQRYTAVWGNPQDVTLEPQAPWIIECVAVKPEARGRGIARRLLVALLEEGRSRGFSHAGISVTTGNLPAERAYAAVGFKLYTAYGEEYFDGAYPGTTKYRMCLGC